LGCDISVKRGQKARHGGINFAVGVSFGKASSHGPADQIDGPGDNKRGGPAREWKELGWFRKIPMEHREQTYGSLGRFI